MKNKTLKLLVALFCFCSLLTINFVKLKASYLPLDEIEEYNIKIDPREDGTLDMHFEITWKVLDSSSEGPLSWVKIGIPNYHVDELKKETSNIKKIKYYSDSGSFIRIDFDRDYREGETLTFAFSIHQSRMYFLSGDECIYDYNPGWFDEIEVKSCTVSWNAKNVKSIEGANLQGDYYVVSSSLSYHETVKLKVVYDQSNFKGLSKKGEYTSAYMTPAQVFGIIATVVGVFAIIIIVVTISKRSQDPYLDHRGFGSYYGYHPWFYYHLFGGRYYRPGVNKKGVRIVNPNSVSSGGKGHSGGGGCACACACACAGGGRAGCSVKDFYNINLRSEKVIEIIKKEERGNENGK